MAFVDESYEDRRDLFVLGCVLCDGAALQALEDGLDTVVAAAARYGVPDTAELHGWEMFHGKEDWAVLKGKARAQVGVYADAFSAIASSGALIITSTLHKKSALTVDPYMLAFRYLAERIDSYARRSDTHVIVICDDIDEGAAQRRHLDDIRARTTRGWKPTKIERIRDTMHFADSKNSRGLQAADLVAFLYRRFLRLSEPGQQIDRREAKSLERLFELFGGTLGEGGIVIEHKSWTPP